MKNVKIHATWAETALLLSVTTSKEANGIGCEVVLTHGEKGVGGGNGDFYIPAFYSFLALSSVREKPLLQFLAFAGICEQHNVSVVDRTCNIVNTYDVCRRDDACDDELKDIVFVLSNRLYSIFKSSLCLDAEFATVIITLFQSHLSYNKELKFASISVMFYMMH